MQQGSKRSSGGDRFFVEGRERGVQGLSARRCLSFACAQAGLSFVLGSVMLCAAWEQHVVWGQRVVCAWEKRFVCSVRTARLVWIDGGQAWSGDGGLLSCGNAFLASLSEYYQGCTNASVRAHECLSQGRLAVMDLFWLPFLHTLRVARVPQSGPSCCHRMLNWVNGTGLKGVHMHEAWGAAQSLLPNHWMRNCFHYGLQTAQYVSVCTQHTLELSSPLVPDWLMESLLGRNFFWKRRYKSQGGQASDRAPSVMTDQLRTMRILVGAARCWGRDQSA